MTDDPDLIRLDASTDLDDIDLPATLGDRLASLYGVDSVSTAEDWVAAISAAAEPTAGDSLGLDDLCTTDTSPHILETDDGTQAYQCVFDPMLVPFVTDAPATVRSECPTTGERVTFEVNDGVRADTETAVFSVGIAPGAAGDPPFTPAETYGYVCPYGNIFADRAAYDAWADETDAITASLPLEYGVALVGGLARHIDAT